MKPPAQRRSPFQTLLAGAAGLLVLVLAIAGARSYQDLVAVKTREADFQRRIAATEERTDALRREIELLRDDPAALERHAREDLGLVMPNDVVLLLPPDNESSSVAPGYSSSSQRGGLRDRELPVPGEPK